MKNYKIRDDLWERIRSKMDEIKIVDTHEHLGRAFPIFTISKKYNMNLITFLAHSYLYGDLISSGMKMIPPEKMSWQQLKPFLENVKNSIYFRYLLRALKDFYGLKEDNINDNNWKAISYLISKKTENHIQWSLEVLDLMNIHRMILDISKGCIVNTEMINDDRLVQVVKMDDFIMGGLNIVKKFTNNSVDKLDDYLEVLDMAFEIAKMNKVIGVKCAIGYNRIISFDSIEKSEAQKIFSNGIRNVSLADRKKFQDYMMHIVCERSIKHDLPIQVHTGLQAGNFNDITNAKPTHLTNLFKKYKKARFVLFHGSYPYIQEAGVLAKYFPNVYLDACWLSHISPSSYRRGLDEWLDIVPSNKIFAWGGDHEIIEHSYASLMLAKDLITDVLVNKIISGDSSEKIAISLMEKILHGNSINFYGL